MTIRNRYFLLLICTLSSSVGVNGTEAWYFDLHLNGKDSWFLGIDQDGMSLDGCVERSAIRLDYYCEMANKGFNNCGMVGQLSSVVFNRCFMLSDISLFINLSAENKVHCFPLTTNENPLSRCQRPALGPGEIPQPWGFYRSDLYTTLLAPTSVCLDAEKRETEVALTYIRHFESNHQKGAYTGYVGLRLPIQSRLHLLDYQLLGGTLFNGIVSLDGALLQNTLSNFYSDYTSLEDFFLRGILGPKKLCYKPRKRKTGFGDLSAFGMLYITPCDSFTKLLQLGVNLVIPTAGKLKTDYVWEPYLGNGGAFQIDLFTTLLLDTGSTCWNMGVRASAEISQPFTTCYRVPQCKTNEVQSLVTNIDDLLIVGPSTFSCSWALPYEQLDSAIPGFSDEAIPTKIRWGAKWIIGICNYFYDTFVQRFRLGLFYDYIGKKEDRYEPRCCNKQFCPNLLTYYTRERKHRLSWDLAYLHKDWCEVSVGSKHVVGGQNVAQTQEFHAQLSIVF